MLRLWFAYATPADTPGITRTSPRYPVWILDGWPIADGRMLNNLPYKTMTEYSHTPFPSNDKNPGALNKHPGCADDPLSTGSSACPYYFAVESQKITAYSVTEIETGDIRIPIGRSYKELIQAGPERLSRK